MQKAYFDSPIGVLEICSDESGVCELNFVRDFVCTDVTDANLKLCLSELESYFKGELKTFKTRLNIGENDGATEGVSRGRLGERKKQNPDHRAMPQSRRLKRPWRIQRRRRTSD